MRPSTCCALRSPRRVSTKSRWRAFATSCRRSSFATAQIKPQSQPAAGGRPPPRAPRWWAAAFPGHPYGEPGTGTQESLAAITVDDMKEYVRNVFARDTLIIGIVGDLDAEKAGKIIDRIFGSLPEKAKLKPVPAAAMQ